MKRSPLKRSAFKRKATHKKLSPISKDKARRDKRFIPKAVMEALLLRSGGQCEVSDETLIPPNGMVGFSFMMRCQNKADDPHHVLPKSRGGKNTLDNLLHLCRYPHHAMCKDKPLEAKKLGILK